VTVAPGDDSIDLPTDAPPWRTVPWGLGRTAGGSSTTSRKSPAEGRPTVTVGCGQALGNVTVRNADDGPRIPDDRKGNVFGKGDNGIGSPGTGIGLYLLETLLDEFGGDVWIEDNEPTGAVGCVELPTMD